ncbi:uncharacterized protein PAC_05687 [Phialocephala subalpina]|uniref:Zn(2)-C6 fungal-type domain-containing protein n=1 Tax=Phialocephala subalpina TaxID=576137 RepID=A0A1L7WSP5_9HELO|nr:uncharacterized protein PAC_05687 [Phialocephala subalpina]
MVNVAGRSKGCSTCRKRRVKCDETRPICNRCLRSGAKCDGAKDIAFVEAKIVKSRRTVKRTAMTPSSSCDSGDTDRQPPMSPILRGNEIEIYICYTQKHGLRGPLMDLAIQDGHLNDVIPAEPSATIANDRIFQQAVLSFSVIFFGTQHGHSIITSKGYAMYGVALSQLNQALSDPKCYTRDEVILSVIALALLEVFIPTGPSSFLEHMLGLEKLLELRDTNFYLSPKHAELYKAVRYMILFAAIQSGRPSNLAKPEWKAALRVTCSEEEMQEQDLLDIFADCTVLVAKRDHMLANWGLDLEDDAHQRDYLKRRALTLLNQLRAWRRQWDTDQRHRSVDTPAASPESWGSASPPFITGLEFANEAIAAMLMFYNTVLINVLRVLASLTFEDLGQCWELDSLSEVFSNQNLSQNTPQDAGCHDDLWKLTKDDYTALERLVALEICRSIPYYVARKLSMELCHSPVVHLAVTTAWTTLGSNESAEGRWIMDLLNKHARDLMEKGVWKGC